METEMSWRKVRKCGNALITTQEGGPTETQTCTNLLVHQKDTMKRITEPNCDQGNSEGSQMHPCVGMKS